MLKLKFERSAIHLSPVAFNFADVMTLVKGLLSVYTVVKEVYSIHSFTVVKEGV